MSDPKGYLFENHGADEEVQRLVDQELSYTEMLWALNVQEKEWDGLHSIISNTVIPPTTLKEEES